MTKLTLTDLNTARAYNGKAPLKSYKESYAKLEAAYATEMLNKSMRDNFVAPADEISKQTVRQDIINNRTVADTTDEGTSNPAKTAALKEARLENDRKDAALAALEADKPSPSAKPAKSVNPVAKKQTKQPKREFSVAGVLKELGFTDIKEIKIARAKLRRNAVAKTPAAIKAFFKK